MATLGWNDGTEQEIFSRTELISKFELGRVQRGGARFDEHRLIWMNGYHIRQLSIDDLYKLVESFWPQEADKYDEQYKKRVLSLVQERLKFFAELPDLTNFFFKDLPINPELISGHKQLGKMDHQDLKDLLNQARGQLEQSSFDVDDLSSRLNKLLEDTKQKPAVLFSLIRIATTQAHASPSLADTMEVLGREVSLRRLEETIESL